MPPGGGLLPLLGAIAALAAAPAAAEPWRLRLDPQASEVTMELDATLHTVPGRFRLTEGVLRFDPETGQASGEVVVDATSGATGIDARDRVMHEDVLASERFPRIVLRAERLAVETRGGDRLEGALEGRLELRGTPHPVRIPFVARREGGRGRVEGAFDVPYVAWGLPDPSTFLLRVGKVVRVRFAAEGDLTAP